MVFSISDLHLSFDQEKPMDIFGENWHNHADKIATDWLKKVAKDDIILIPGDISWGLKLEEAITDLEFIDKLPGRKIIIKGNHDYWWSSYSKIKQLPLKTIDFIQNNSILAYGISYCGTRGWLLPEDGLLSEEDEKIYKRELQRLELSLKRAESNHIVVLLHYPPFAKNGEASEFVQLMMSYGVEKCVYGHIHRHFENRSFIEGIYQGIEYKLVSCDYLNFKLAQIF